MRPKLHILGQRLRRIPLEAAIWTAGLVAMACADPEAPGLLDGCLFRWLGVEWCPGCGLGHAVGHLFRGEWTASLEAHSLGWFAVLVLGGHVIQLVWKAFTQPLPSAFSLD